MEIHFRKETEHYSAKCFKIRKSSFVIKTIITLTVFKGRDIYVIRVILFN